MENGVAKKSMAFAIQIVNLYKYLSEEKKEFVLSKQLLRAGTSIGANIREAGCAISKKEFTSKMYIAFKECSETAYWLDILHSTQYLNDREYESISSACTELLKMLSAITKTAKENQNE